MAKGFMDYISEKAEKSDRERSGQSGREIEKMFDKALGKSSHAKSAALKKKKMAGKMRGERCKDCGTTHSTKLQKHGCETGAYQRPNNFYEK